MPAFYITFGQRYRDEPHPHGSHIHPDGYVTIIAADETAARERAFETFKDKWAFLYSTPPESKYFTRGNLFTLI